MAGLYLLTLDWKLVAIVEGTPPETPAGLTCHQLTEIGWAYRRHYQIHDPGCVCLGWERGETSIAAEGIVSTTFKIDLSVRVAGRLLLTHTARTLLLSLVPSLA
jgi:hypothetical protein